MWTNYIVVLLRLWLHGNKESSITTESSEKEGKSGGKKGFTHLGGRKRNNRREIEETGDREAEMMKKNYYNKLELEVFLTVVVVTAAERQNGEHMWKQSSRK